MSSVKVTTPDRNVNKSENNAIEVTPEPDVRRRNIEVNGSKSVVTERAVNVNGSDKIGGQDLSHSIKGEYLLKRKTNVLEFKNGLDARRVNSHRKKLKKSKWQVAVNILIMIFLLLGSILWLNQLIWTWRDMLNYKNDPSFAILDGEDRLSEMEASLKTTAGLLQLQLDVVDKKVTTEIETTKNEMNMKLEERGTQLEKEFKKLEIRTDSLGKSLADLIQTDFLTKKEYASFLNELKKKGAVGKSGSNMSLDTVRDAAKQIVEMEIEKHAADGLGRVDYALGSAGARVIRHSDPYIDGRAEVWITIKNQYKVYAKALKMLEPSFGEPGQCFALKGTSGFVDIRLRTTIIPEAVTLEHVSKSLAYDRSSAPKNCRVSALVERPGDDSSNFAEKMFLLTEFSYALEKSNAQTYDVDPGNARPTNMIRFAFSSNHGSSTHTCVYRLRVHGHDPNFDKIRARQSSE